MKNTIVIEIHNGQVSGLYATEDAKIIIVDRDSMEELPDSEPVISSLGYIGKDVSQPFINEPDLRKKIVDLQFHDSTAKKWQQLNGKLSKFFHPEVPGDLLTLDKSKQYSYSITKTSNGPENYELCVHVDDDYLVYQYEIKQHAVNDMYNAAIYFDLNLLGTTE